MTEQAIPELLKKAQDLGYKIFTSGDFNLNLIGVRAAEQEPNKFCDSFNIIYKKMMSGYGKNIPSPQLQAHIGS